MTEDTRQRLFEIIAKAKHIPVEIVTLNKTFEELSIDSLDAINILFEVEEEFKIAVPDDRVTEMRSIRDVIEGIEALLAARTAS